MSIKIKICAVAAFVAFCGAGLKAETEIVFKIHTVVEGDTFFKLSQKYYNSGERWKEIKKYNGYIKNSHWIFPGDEIIIPIEREKKEVAVEPETAVKEKKPDVNYDVFVAPYRPDSASPLDFKYTGKVSAFTEEIALHAQRSKVILDTGAEDGIQMNDVFDIYRASKKIYHPETKKIMGILIRRIGRLEITDNIEADTCIATITSSKGSIRIGDFVRAIPAVK